MVESDWRSSLTSEEVEVLASCLRAAVEGPFFPEWEFSTLLGFERAEVEAVANSWPATADGEREYRVLSAVLNNLLGYPHNVTAASWREWIAVDRTPLDDLYSEIRERSGANDRLRAHLKSQLEVFAGLDPAGLERSGRIVGDVANLAERLGVPVPNSVVAYGAGVAFRDVGRGFCDFVERGDLSIEELRSRLVSLVDRADRLPMVEPSGVEYDDPEGLDDRCRAVSKQIGELVGRRAFYELKGDSGELLIGDLRDDAFDIFRDLQRGLSAFAVNQVDGVWELRFSFEAHWGEHARSAIGALDARIHPGEET